MSKRFVAAVCGLVVASGFDARAVAEDTGAPAAAADSLEDAHRHRGPLFGPRTPLQRMLQRASFMLMLRNYDAAFNFYKKALALDPELGPHIRLRMSFCLFMLKRLDEAIAELKQLIDKHPKFLLAYEGLAKIHMEKKDLDAAQAVVDAGLKVSADAPGLLSRAGQIARMRAEAGGDGAAAHKARAIEIFEKLGKLVRPRSPLGLEVQRELLILRIGPAGGKVLDAREALAKGDPAQALKLADEALAASPNLAEALLIRGQALSTNKLNRLAEAIESFKKANTKEAFVALGQIHYEKGDMEEAEELFKKALGVDAGLQEAHYQLGLVYRELGEYPKALDSWRQAIRVQPGSKLAQWAATKLQVLTGELKGLAEGEVLDPASERHLGQKFLEAVEKKWGFVKDEALEARLTEIARRLVAVSDRSGEALRYEVKIANRPGINAVTFPGGKILFFRGMIDLVRKDLGDSDDAFAAVLGHEIAHAALRHGVTKAKILSARASLTGDKFRAAASLQTFLSGFSRANEFEADQYGALYAYRAGFNPAGSLALHEAMLAKNEIPEGLGHPPHAERIARLREYLLDLRAKVRSFKLALRAMKRNEYTRAVHQFEVFLGVFPKSSAARNNLALAMYKKALVHLPATAYRRSGDIDPDAKAPRIRLRAAPAALKGAGGGAPAADAPIIDKPLLREAVGELQLVLRNDPSYVPAHVNLAAALLDLGAARDVALTHLQTALQIDPENLHASNNLAVAYLEGAETEKGLAILNKLAARAEPVVEAVYNLGIAHERAGQKADAAKAFTRYLELDSTSGWAKLARTKLDALK
jgi:predicted Zn-dependent protease